MESFFKANLALTKTKPDFNVYDESNPIFTTWHHLPGAKLFSSIVDSSIICEGSIVEAKEIKQSILGPRSVVKKGTVIHESYLMGNDFYKHPVRTDKISPELSIGENCIIKKTIIDKNASIGNNVQLINKNKLEHYNSDDIYIRDGIIIITRGAVLPDGFIL